MIFRSLLLLLFITNLCAKDDSWYSKIHPELETGMHISDFNGKHSTTSNYTTDFKDDFGYKDSYSSYFALDFKFDYSYVPNLKISYFNVSQSRDADFTNPFKVVNFDYNGSVTTKIDYSVTNILLSYELKSKGSRVSIWRYKIYPGDISYSLGLNIKLINWYFQIIDRGILDAVPTFIRVNSSIPMPYIGMKYYYYNFRIFGDISTLSFSTAKSTNYQFGFEYKVIKDLFLSVSYKYEDFEATEKQDTINFKTSGNKFSFKYTF